MKTAKFNRKAISGRDTGDKVTVMLVDDGTLDIHVMVDDGENQTNVTYSGDMGEGYSDPYGFLDFEAFVEGVVKPDYESGEIMPIPVF